MVRPAERGAQPEVAGSFGISRVASLGGSLEIGDPVRHASPEVIHEAMKSSPARQERSTTASGRLSVLAVQLAAAALLAHLLIAAHSVSHLSQGPVSAASQHCAICATGSHSAAIPTAVLAGCQFTATWVLRGATRPVAPLPEVDEASLARAPPFSALAAIG